MNYPHDLAALQLEEERRFYEEHLTRFAINRRCVININDVYPSKYLKASDLQGRTVKVTIAAITIEELGQDRKPILTFKNKQKGLALNKSNAQIISSVYSPETNGWIGKDIELRPDKTQFNGQLVDCIRVQIPAPPAEEFGGEPVPF